MATSGDSSPLNQLLGRIMQTISIRSVQRSVDGGVDSNILQRNISIIEAVQIQLVRIETLFSDHESASPVTPRGHCISTSCTALYSKSSRSPVSHRSHYMIDTWHVGWAIVDLRDPH